MDSNFPPYESAPSIPFEAPQLPVVPDYRDRSTGLRVFGIIQIILGCFALLMIPFIMLSMMMARKIGGASMPPGNYLLSISSYVVGGAVLLTLGVGSIRARRWAWALTLIFSWFWLIAGALGTILLLAILPSAMLARLHTAADTNPNAGAAPAVVMAVILTFMIAFFAVFFVVLPTIFVVFYRKPDVRQTVRHRDPVERWTDRAPLPVLAASLALAGGAAYCLLASVTVPVFPLFGRYVTGLPAGLIFLALAALDGALAYFLFRLRLAAWWIVLFSLAIRTVSAALTFGRANLLDAYARIGWSQQQLQAMRTTSGALSGGILYSSLAVSAIFLFYLLWIKRYFRTPEASAQLS